MSKKESISYKKKLLVLESKVMKEKKRCQKQLDDMMTGKIKVKNDASLDYAYCRGIIMTCERIERIIYQMLNPTVTERINGDRFEVPDWD